MMTKFNLRVVEVCRIYTGLLGFKEQASEATVRVVAAEKKLEDLRKLYAAENTASANSCQQVMELELR